MFWLYVAAAGFGLLLGFYFRVATVAAASVVMAVASVALGPLLAGWSISTVLSAVFGGTFALQCGYFAGLLATCAWSRVDWPDLRERLVGNYRSLLARAARGWML
jgi:hypothetical protein